MFRATMRKKNFYLAVFGLLVAGLLAACGDNTVTSVPATTAATTTSAATTAAATTAPPVTTAVATSAAATTAASTTSAASTTAIANTTAATTGTLAPTFDIPAPEGTALNKADMQKFATVYNDKPFSGGQTAPYLAKFVNKDVFLFMQFDKPGPDEATTLRYIGMGQKGVFCSEAQPGGPKNGFSHFQRYKAETYGAGTGGQAGEAGYWLLALAVDNFETPNGKASPGIDYSYSPTAAPACGANVPKPDFNPAGADSVTKDKLVELANLFNDKAFVGGQVPPRLSKFVNKDVIYFLQFDKSVPAEVTTLRDMGIGVRSQFCQQPTADFSHFHRYSAASYGAGHGGLPTSQGYWLQFNAVMPIESGGTTIQPGPDRNFSLLPPPASCSDTNGKGGLVAAGGQAPATAAAASGGPVQEIKLVTQLTAQKPFVFAPDSITIKVGTTVRWVNGDNVFHTVTSTDALDKKKPNGLFDKYLAKQGDTFEFTFTKPGTYFFYCQPHASTMFGTIKVES